MTVGRLLLSSRNREEDWLNFKNLDLSRINQEEGDIIPTLKLSYDSLSSNLKQCFAYCSIFPKGHVLVPRELTRMWVAQGFISSSNHKTPEEVSQEYFMELVWRSFFQDIEEDTYGNIVGCKMHDLMHDLAKLVAGDNCIILDASNDGTVPERCRHVSSYSEDFQLKTDERDKRLRTFLLLNKYRGRMDCGHHFDQCIDRLRTLRALCLRGTPTLRLLTTSIGKLTHLRHLDLSHNIDLEVLPLSISNLCNLETLNLEGCTGLRELPRGITKLVSLRQLDIRGCTELTHIPKGIGRLTCLQVLSQFVVSEKGDLNAAPLDELKGLKRLKRDLNIRCLENLHGSNTSFRVQEFNLQALELLWAIDRPGDDRPFPDEARATEEAVLERFRPHRDLKGLRVEGYRGGMFSAWVSQLQNLVRLEVGNCSFKRLPYVDQLTHLKRLCLAGLRQLECIEISERSQQHWMSRRFFPSIEELELTDLPEFSGWETGHEDSKMLPTFSQKVDLEIHGCPKLSYMKIQGQQLSLVRLTDSILKQLVRMGMESKPASMASVYSISVAELKSVVIDNMVEVEHLQLPKQLLQSLLSLQSLAIKNCHPLKTVSGTILRYLTNLETLTIVNCSELDLSVDNDGNDEDNNEGTPNVLTRGLSKLRTLHIDELPKMEHFPEWLQTLSHLDRLSISDCDGLKALPHWMGNLSSLRTLTISSCQGLRSLPRTLILQFLTTLESLSIVWCPELDLSGELEDKEEGQGSTSSSRFPGPAKLFELAIVGSTKMASLPWWIQHLTNLESLDISFCESLKALPEWFSRLTSLKRLDASLCGQLSQRCKREIGADWPKICGIDRVQA